MHRIPQTFCYKIFIERLEIFSDPLLVKECISTSLIFLFMAGISWPKEMIPSAWRYLSYFIPYTWGAHAFIHINSMGATLAQTSMEYTALWILAGGYMLLACGLFYLRKSALFRTSRPLPE